MTNYRKNHVQEMRTLNRNRRKIEKLRKKNLGISWAREMESGKRRVSERQAEIT